MQELEFKITQTPAKLDANFDEIKAALQTQMTAYNQLELTEDLIPERKQDLATLRKIRKVIDDRRKDIKKEFNAPFVEFENKVKELLSVIDSPIEMIDSGLKEFDRKRVEEKQAKLRELYDQNISGMEEYLPFESLKKPTWDNKSTKDKEIIDDIQIAVIRVKNDINAIKSLVSPIEDELFDLYKRTKDLTAVIKRSAEYLKDRERIIEEQRKKEEEKAVTQEPVKEEPVIQEPVPVTVKEDDDWRPVYVKANDYVTVCNLLTLNGITYKE